MEPIYVAAAVIVIFFLWKLLSPKRQKNIHWIDPNDVLEEQMTKNRIHVSGIILGHYTPLSKRRKQKSTLAYARWQKMQQYLARRATKVLIDYYKKDKGEAFRYVTFDQRPSIDVYRYLKNWVLVNKNCFSEPSHASMDHIDYVLRRSFDHLFILNGISPKQSLDYVVHIKYKYTNHGMAKMICQYDLYKRC